MKIRRLISKFCLASLFAGASLNAHATSITFESIDLTDVVVNEDLHQGSLTVADRVFNEGEGFTVYFPNALFSIVETGLDAIPGWDVLLLGPNIGGDLLYDALAFTASSSTALPFTFDFTFLGSGVPPGEFAFDVYDATFATIESGKTIAGTPAVTVPEVVATGWMLALSVIALGGLRTGGKALSFRRNS